MYGILFFWQLAAGLRPFVRCVVNKTVLCPALFVQQLLNICLKMSIFVFSLQRNCNSSELSVNSNSSVCVPLGLSLSSLLPLFIH